MDNLFALTDSITQDINEETSAANIAYIPGGFLKTKQAIIALATKKPEWDIKILEKEDKYNVDFEDVLSIIIHKDDYNHFNTNVCNIKGLKQIDLSSVLNEAVVDNTQSTVQELNQTIQKKLREQFVVANSFYLAQSWKRIFGGQAAPSQARALLSIEGFDKDVVGLMNRIKLNFLDDVGEMERAIEAIRNKTPMNDIDLFESYDYLVAQEYNTTYQGVKMRFSCAVNMAWQPVEEIWIDNIEVVDELEFYRKYIKALRTTVKPVNGFFNTSIFEAIVDIIQDLK